MKLTLITVLWLATTLFVYAGPVNPDTALKAAQNKLKTLPEEYSITGQYDFADGKVLFYVFSLSPGGFIIINGDNHLEPVYAWSLSGEYISGHPLETFVRYDIELRTAALPSLPDRIIKQREEKWNDLLNGSHNAKQFEQWPAAGTTSTEGWLEENWTQNYPYNVMCPVDPVTMSRSIAGCPAVAMGSIVNFHRALQGVSFSNADDYFHNYAGRQYYIDDDADSYDFPDFNTLNKLLDTAQSHLSSCQGADDTDKGAIVFACGVAATQVYTSSGSGTFGVSQAYEAFLKFNYNTVELLDENSPGLYDRIQQNIKDTLPVHLAVVDPGWTMGHNVVIDGYNTDGYFHLNFGWGGSYNGWYGLPDEIPYGLTVIEGAVVDIIPGSSVSVGKTAGNTICISPNPATTFLLVTGNSSRSEILLSDISGKIHFTAAIPAGGSHITLPRLEKGVYFCRMVSGHSAITKKVVIE
jgi:hypothetical protein